MLEKLYNSKLIRYFILKNCITYSLKSIRIRRKKEKKIKKRLGKNIIN